MSVVLQLAFDFQAFSADLRLHIHHHFSRRCLTACSIFIPLYFMNLSFSFLLFSAAGALRWRHFAAAFAAGCYRFSHDAIPVALPIPCTSADANSSANISSSTTLASNGTTCTTNDATFSSPYHSTATGMAVYSSLSSTIDTTTTRVSSFSHFSNSPHFTFTFSRPHVSFHYSLSFYHSSSTTTNSCSYYTTVQSLLTTTDSNSMGPQQGVWQPFSAFLLPPGHQTHTAKASTPTEPSQLTASPLPLTTAPTIPPSPATAPSAPDAAHTAVTTKQTSSATSHPPNTPPPSTPAGSVHSEGLMIVGLSDPLIR